jgi:DNA-binding NarL/FixJ family response regulator
MAIKVAIIDDKGINRQSVRERLASAKDVEIVLLADNGSTFLDKMKELKPEQRPDVCLMDIDMPIMDGIAAVGVGKELYPTVEFLMLTIFDDDDKIFEAIKSGASGYLLKEESMEKLIDAIRQVKEFGAVPMSPLVARKAIAMLAGGNRNTNTAANNGQKAGVEYNLSEREMEILKCMVEGLDYRQIGDKIFLSPHTVRTHIGNIYKKLHVCSKVDAVKIALKKQWF